jgi:BMFP domain-containing protein YqiC
MGFVYMGFADIGFLVLPDLEARIVPTHVMSSVPNRHLFEQLQDKINALLAQSPAQDLERNLKALLSGFFSRLDLVTREEFDIQRQVLLRTREKIERLEARVAELEQRLGK